MLGVSEELGIGFLTGITSRAITTPLSVITVRLQTQTEGEDEEGELNAEKGDIEEAKRKKLSKGIIEITRCIYQEEGLKGFWDGTSSDGLRHSVR